ncbi:MAG: PDZ domain-containing protein [Pseudomonadota bacterium]
MRARTAAIAVGLLLAGGIATLVYVERSDPPQPGIDDTDIRSSAVRAGDRAPHSVQAAIESLTRIVDEEIVERRALEEQVTAMQTELSELRQLLGGGASASRANNRQTADPAAVAAAAERTVEDRLTAVGFTAAEIERVRDIEARMQMQQIELDYEARQDGWANTPRYYEAIRAAASGGGLLREELGDNAFDRYLFATRGANRVAVSTVIENSPAATAGLRPGDVIHSYGGERVFMNQELTELRSIGTRGIPVIVDVIRDGQHVQLTMPRGPMGVQLTPTSIDPNE